jgi:predicted RNA-binding protein YlqC (UPF0109 family)
MTTEQFAEDLALLLGRLLEALIDHPRELQIQPRVMRDRVDLHVTPNINDQGIVVGKGGAHIKALKFLAQRMGILKQQQAVIFLHEDDSGERLPEPLRAPASPAYSCSEHRQLLADLLAAVVDHPVEIEVDRSGKAFTFVLHAKRIQDFELLHETDVVGQSIITALGTLFRAAGNRNGVSYKIEAAR